MIGFVIILSSVLTLLVFLVFYLLLKYGKHHKSDELYAWFTSLMLLFMVALVINGMTNILNSF